MKKILIGLAIAAVFLVIVYTVGSGFFIRHDVLLSDFSLSEDQTEITLSVMVSSSMGYIRGYRDVGGGVKPHMLQFYCAFGGLNSSFGATDTVILPLGKDDTEIFFSRPGKGYELVLEKNSETGVWQRPSENAGKPAEDFSEKGTDDLVYRGEPQELHDLVYRGEEVAILFLSKSIINQ